MLHRRFFSQQCESQLNFFKDWPYNYWLIHNSDVTMMSSSDYCGTEISEVIC